MRAPIIPNTLCAEQKLQSHAARLLGPSFSLFNSALAGVQITGEDRLTAPKAFAPAFDLLRLQRAGNRPPLAANLGGIPSAGAMAARIVVAVWMSSRLADPKPKN
jgi:hypothetical protein